MSDRDPTSSDGGTSELEPPASARTEPIDPGEPVTPPPPGGYASLGRARPRIPGSLIVVGVVILAIGTVLGFLLGRAMSDEVVPGRERVERGDSGGGGGGGGDRAARRERRRACREVTDLQARLIDLQQRVVANQVALTEAVIAEDVERISALTATAEAFQARVEQRRAELVEAEERCRPA